MLSLTSLYVAIDIKLVCVLTSGLTDEIRHGDDRG